MRRSASGLGLVILQACAYSFAPIAAGRDLHSELNQIDWDAETASTAALLVDLIRFDTSNPPGNEAVAASYLAQVLAQESIVTQIVELEPGRASLIAKLSSGKNGPPLCLLSHLDVVPAKAEEWPSDRGPFSGATDDKGQIWGRGALDMKGMVALEARVLLMLKRLNLPLNRDVVMLAVADEEIGGRGMQQIVNDHWDTVRCGHVINEGGYGVKDVVFPGQTVYPIAVAEKGMAWITMALEGEGGHGSTPRPEHTPLRLVRAIEPILEQEAEPIVLPTMSEFFARVGDHHGGFSGFVLKRPSLRNLFAMGKLMAKPATKATITHTCSLTGINADGGAPNVVPANAVARWDCRFLPGYEKDVSLAWLASAKELEPKLELTVTNTRPATLSEWVGDEVYSAIARAVVGGRTDVVAGPFVTVGMTDSSFARVKGAKAYGMIPLEITMEELATMHAPNERVSLSNLKTGLQVLWSVVVDVARDVPPPARGEN